MHREPADLHRPLVDARRPLGDGDWARSDPSDRAHDMAGPARGARVALATCGSAAEGRTAVILLTGVLRAVTFKAFGWTGDVARDRIRLLKIKHALLGAVFLAGTAC